MQAHHASGTASGRTKQIPTAYSQGTLSEMTDIFSTLARFIQAEETVCGIIEYLLSGEVHLSSSEPARYTSTRTR